MLKHGLSELGLPTAGGLTSSAKSPTSVNPVTALISAVPTTQESTQQYITHGEAHYHGPEHYSDHVTLQEGRHSIVVSAWHQHTSQPVVIKAYTKATLKPRQLENVHREIKLLEFLRGRCQHVVTMLAAFEDEPKLYLVFKACMRGDLYQLLMKEPSRRLNEHLVASSIVLPLVLTVAHLHSMQIIHRDIKPENVFIDMDGKVQLGDFGLAACHTDSLTERVGTLDYMAPEVLAMPTPSEIAAGRTVPPHPYNEKVDVWAMGCLCYELLVGAPPFEVEDPKETAKLIMVGKPASFPATISQEACDFIRQTLAHKPGLRPSAKQLLEHPWLRQFSRPRAHRPAPAPSPATTAHPHATTDRQPPAAPAQPSGLPGAPTAMDGARSSSDAGHNHRVSASGGLSYEQWGVDSMQLLHIHDQQLLMRQQQPASAAAAAAAASPPEQMTCGDEARTPLDRYGSLPEPVGASDSRAALIGPQTSDRLPPGPHLSEGSSADDPSDGGAASKSPVAQLPGARNNRRASSGTSEYLAYNTPRCGSPEHMSRSASASLLTQHSPFSSPASVPPGALPGADQGGVGLRSTASCTGAVEGKAAGSDGDQLPHVLAWQNSSGPASGGKSRAVGKSRFAR